MLKDIQFYDKLQESGYFKPEFRLKSSSRKERASMSDQQEPHTLWFGCSDSRVIPNMISGTGLGEIFVHRNIANLVKPDDTSTMAALEYAIQILRVDNIVVCGHYQCGGVIAALEKKEEQPLESFLDHWIDDIVKLKAEFGPEMEAFGDQQSRVNYLCEKNVLRQVEHIRAHALVKKNPQIKVFALIMDLKSGIVQNLENRVAAV